MSDNHVPPGQPQRDESATQLPPILQAGPKPKAKPKPVPTWDFSALPNYTDATTACPAPQTRLARGGTAVPSTTEAAGHTGRIRHETDGSLAFDVEGLYDYKVAAKPPPPVATRAPGAPLEPISSRAGPSRRKLPGPATKPVIPALEIAAAPNNSRTATVDQKASEGRLEDFPELKSGNDAVEFFARHGVNSPIKFIYLNRTPQPPGGRYRPYSLMVVPREQVDPEHFTMSASGVVHIHPSDVTEFIPLAEWVRQETLFTLMTKIRFFKFYREVKTFRVWRRNVRYKRFSHQRTKLQRRLFLSMPSFLPMLMAVNGLCTKLANGHLLLIDPKKTYNLEEFVEAQNTQRTVVARELESIVEKLHALVEEVCHDVTSRAKVSHDSDDELDELDEGVAFTMRGKEKSKSIVQLRLDEEGRTRNVRQAAAEATLLGSFVRLVDYIAVENLCTLIETAAADFLENLKTMRKSGLFFTSIAFGKQDTIMFQPERRHFRDVMRQLIDGMINLASGIPRLLYMRSFRQFLSGQIGGLQVGQLLRTSETLIHITRSIEETVTKNFAAAVDYVRAFEEFREVHVFGETWNYEEQATKDWSVEELRSFMAKIRKWSSDLEKMKTVNVVGMLHVDSKKLKQALIPITTGALDRMKGLLLSSFKDKLHTALNKHQATIKFLSERPRGLDDFAAYMKMFNEQPEKQMELETMAGGVNEMKDLLDSYEVKLPSDVSIRLDDLVASANSYVDAMGEAQAQIEAKLPSMTASLDRSVHGLKDDVLSLLTSLHTGDYVDKNVDPKFMLDKLAVVKETLDSLQRQADTYEGYQRLFDIPPYEFQNLADTWDLYKLKNELWSSTQQFNNMLYAIKIYEFGKLDMMELTTDIQNLYKSATRIEKKLKDDEVLLQLKNNLEQYRTNLSLLQDLGNPALKPRHWEKVFSQLGRNYFPGMSFTLTDLIDAGVLHHKQFLSELSSTASGEYSLELALEKIAKGWKDVEFDTHTYRDQKDIFILGGVDDIIQLLDDNQVTLQAMIASPSVAGIREDVEVWEKKLGLISEILDEWLSCQRSWMYLEVIFSQPDIQRQLPAEGAKFQEVDSNWKHIMRRTQERPRVLAALEHEGLLKMFMDANKTLEEIGKSLSDYLETKRTAFPRFYFLSDDELLEILSQTRDPRAVQPHLNKCFDNISSLEFREGQEYEIISMHSSDGETVPLRSSVFARGPVENWLRDVERMMHLTLYDKMKACLLANGTMNRSAWFFAFPAQCVSTVDQILWTHAITDALCDIETHPDGLSKYLQACNDQLTEMVNLVRGERTKLERATLNALIIIDVHARDVLDNLVKQGLKMTGDFEWQRQLRYYWENDVDNCMIRQTNASFLYGYEYMGNTTRLVITPLTDRCFVTLTSALHVNLGGAPAGPAGTGKTETTKDLAKALARQCVVFNCSDGLDYKMMGRFFSGLAQAGAWACFDEFNRIDIEVLSVIAQQVLTIQQAIVNGLDRFVFEGHEIPLNPNYGCFITMNPGYAGRTELPDNLKALFRPVAMMIPDYALIAEIILLSEGFQDARNLARKMTQLYRLSSEQLSKQDHYDFGMRALKSVLVMAGALKRADPSTREDVVLIRAMRDSNVPKFLAEDIPLFMAIIQDLFPGVKIPSVDCGALQRAVENQLELANLQCIPTFVSKIIQLFETMQVRHGVMLVGRTGTGKTTCFKSLAKAMSQVKQEDKDCTDCDAVIEYILNPKAVTMGELYGEFNTLTHEWTDGLIADIVRKAVADETTQRKWIVFDGPVDALWIENMNTVLDDNKTLCLSNGERIKLPKPLSMLFEVNDLAVASPATVSRCGMVYFEPVHLGWKPVVTTWVDEFEKRVPGVLEVITKFLDDVVDGALVFLHKECHEDVPSVDINLVTSFLRLMDALLRPEQGITPGQAENEVDLGRSVLMYCFFSFVWSFGGNLDGASRSGFSTFARSLVEDQLPEVPTEGSVYDYFVDPSSWAFVHWSKRMSPFVYDPSLPYFSILVPTIETVRSRYLLEILVNAGHNVLLTGPTGVGKTAIIQEFLSSTSDKFVSAQINMSARTQSNNVQDILEGKLEKKRKNLLGPPSGKRMLVFVDDLNMPMLDEYGSQPPIELLRQCIDSGGFYDRKKLFFKHVRGFIASCAPPGGGRNVVTPRFFRHFNMISLPALAPDSMRHIFSSIVGGFLKRTPGDLSVLSFPIVAASVDIYNRITTELLPTPTKCHYTFNLRDLSKVIQGILQVEPGNLRGQEQVLRLWSHESARIFQDRLVSEEDKQWFSEVLCETVQKHFQVTWDSSNVGTIMFGDFFQRSSDDYVEAPTMDTVLDSVRTWQEDYNSEVSGKETNLVFFHDAVHHIGRICRILRQPRGNALLVGVGGSGRQSLTRLAAHISKCKCYQIEITRGYGMTEFHDDLKKAFQIAGVEQRPIVFLLSDTQIVNEAMLEDINNTLNSGEVPNLFAPDETEQIVQSVRPLAKQAGKAETKDVVWSHFVQLVRENLHIVMCLSPIGDSFRDRVRQCPSFVNCCTIDWYNQWPDDALESVALNNLRDVDLGTEDENIRLAVCKACVHIHSTVTSMSKRFFQELRRHNYTTPTSYLELLNLYIAILTEQREDITAKIAYFKGGLNKLEETQLFVARIQKDLEALQPELAQSVEHAKILLEEVERDQKVADEFRETVLKEEADVQKVTDETQSLRDDAQRDLDVALPAYRAAMKAVKTLDKKDISEVKSFANPPELVMTVMEAVCLLLGARPTWEEAKKLLGDPNFFNYLENYDKDNVNEAILKRLKPYIRNEHFQPVVVEKVSKAAKSLCMWVRAIDTYTGVAKTVAPKKEKLAQAEESLAKSKALLDAKRQELADAEAKVAELQARYQASVKEREDLEARMSETKLRLTRAEQVLQGLEGEQKRWTTAVDVLEVDVRNLVGAMLLAAGCIAYLGPFTSSYRHELLANWTARCKDLGIPVSEDFSLSKVLADPLRVRDWHAIGLPEDVHSIENAILVTRGRRWPLMVDPQGQATRWIKNLEHKNGLQVVKMTDPKFLQTLENAIRIGTPVLLENVEEQLDPALEPILQKQVVKRGGRLIIKLGDEEVDYSPDFRFYITSKLSNPHYLPEVCIKVTIINFTVTTQGLEEQLLADVVRLERIDLEEQKDKLLTQISDGRKEIKEIENRILEMLNKTEGNLLDDESLVQTLQASKDTSQKITTQLKEAEDTAQEINSAREEYRPVATRGSILYFAVADLASIDPMYQYSLAYFRRLFCSGVEKSEKATVLDERLKNMISTITRSVFENVCRGLFEKDKLLFSFTIGVQIQREEGIISDSEWNAFLRGPQQHEMTSCPANPGREWMSDDIWKAIVHFSQITGRDGLPAAFRADGKPWRSFAESDRIYSQSLPPPWEDRLTAFQRLLLVKILREEKAIFATRVYVEHVLGRMFVEPPPFELKGVFQDSEARTPIIFVLSPGADPTSYLMQFAREKGFNEKLKMMSLGQGQGPIAEQLIHWARKEGAWVCLQNCHLALSWMPSLERIVETCGDVHSDFRLWLTSMPSGKFPVSVLQNGIKITNEPPKGLKSNLMRTFLDVTESQFETHRKPDTWKKLLFGLAFFHAVIQERRRYGPLGWNIPYEWNTSDFAISMQHLCMFLEEQEHVPLEALHYVIGEINYGGRVTDLWDLRCGKSILARFFHQEILRDNYHLGSDATYRSLPAGSLTSYRNYISTLPANDPPDIFGLHANADIAFQQKGTRELVEAVLSLQPRTTLVGGGKMTPDEIVLDEVEFITNMLPPKLSMEEAHPLTFAATEDGTVNSLGTFLSQEVVRFNKLLSVMQRTLSELNRAVRGLVVMSPILEKMLNSLLLQKVPDAWAIVAYPSRKPLRPWVKDLVGRVEFIRSWLVGGPPPAFWISAFFFPQGFMTAALQAHARKTKQAVDQLHFRTDVLSLARDDVKDPPENGTYIYGLFMEGARWDRKSRVVTEAHNGELFSEMPVTWLDPVTVDASQPSSVYVCPIYKTSFRAGALDTTGHSTNYVASVHLTTRHPADHWIRRGVALLCQLDT